MLRRAASLNLQGDDLYLSRTISLSDALCGFEMQIEHLDGRTLIIKTKPGDVIKPVAYDPLSDNNVEVRRRIPGRDPVDVLFEAHENCRTQIHCLVRAATNPSPSSMVGCRRILPTAK